MTSVQENNNESFINNEEGNKSLNIETSKLLGENDDSPPDLCTFAVTEHTAAFQAIYVCHTCSGADNGGRNEVPTNACVCQSCAYICHGEKGCDIEYVGVGHCNCDCSSILGNCCLIDTSRQVAQDMGIITQSGEGRKDVYIDIDIDPANEEKAKKYETKKASPFPFVAGVYSIPCLNDNYSNCDRLIRQAVELIKHTKDTHWITPSRELMDGEQLCELEMLALAVFKQHFQAFHLAKFLSDDFNPDKPSDNMDILWSNTNIVTGAEWWVQIKSISNKSFDTPISESNNSDEAVDLHYDKDEALAETFGLGSFPTLSTVTYLTDTNSNVQSNIIGQSPTIIFPHVYHQGEDHSIHQTILSYPKKGKHLVFDGRLLHGAPSNLALRKRPISVNSETISTDVETNSIRVTFLVNIWIGNKPANVNPLDPDIRSHILGTAPLSLSSSTRPPVDSTFKEFYNNAPSTTQEPFMKQETMTSFFIDEDRIDADNASMIHLPFISSSNEDYIYENEDKGVDVNEDGQYDDVECGLANNDEAENEKHIIDNEDATHAADYEDNVIDVDVLEENDLVLLMYVPPTDIRDAPENDTIHLEFHKGLLPYLQRGSY